MAVLRCLCTQHCCVAQAPSHGHFHSVPPRRHALGCAVHTTGGTPQRHLAPAQRRCAGQHMGPGTLRAEAGAASCGRSVLPACTALLWCTCPASRSLPFHAVPRAGTGVHSAAPSTTREADGWDERRTGTTVGQRQPSCWPGWQLGWTRLFRAIDALLFVGPASGVACGMVPGQTAECMRCVLLRWWYGCGQAQDSCSGGELHGWGQCMAAWSRTCNHDWVPPLSSRMLCSAQSPPSSNQDALGDQKLHARRVRRGYLLRRERLSAAEGEAPSCIGRGSLLGRGAG